MIETSFLAMSASLCPALTLRALMGFAKRTRSEPRV